MFPRVPPVGRHVDAAAKCDYIVDDNNLLMMRRCFWMSAIELEVNALARQPVENGERSRSTPQCMNCPKVPFQDEDFNVGPVLVDPPQKGAKLVRPIQSLALGLRQQFLPGRNILGG